MNNPYSCIICNAAHSEMWGTHPSMYCAPCAQLKRDAKGVVTHVLGPLHLGDLNAAKSFNGERLCVHENPAYATTEHHIPFLTKPPKSPLDRSGAIASKVALDRITEFMEQRFQSGTSLIIHCKGGVERSPLAFAYFFVKTGRLQTFDDAYEYLKSIRPVVSPRLFWLP